MGLVCIMKYYPYYVIIIQFTYYFQQRERGLFVQFVTHDE